MPSKIFSSFIALLALSSVGQAGVFGRGRSEVCPDDSDADYDYIVVGSGAGGGPLSARLALANYRVLLIDAGYDAFTHNYSIPLYLSRNVDDPKTNLQYRVNLYAPGEKLQINNYYPRGSALGGSTAQNALVAVDQSKHSFNEIASILGDSSWNYDSMRNYLVKLEKNLYIDPSTGTGARHGYNGWLNTNVPSQNLLSDPQYYDPQLLDLVNATVQDLIPRFYPNGGDMNDVSANDRPGAGGLVYNVDGTYSRNSVRDFLRATLYNKRRNFQFLPNTLATKIRTCSSSSEGTRAYGVDIASGSALLPVAALFTGKRTLRTRTVTAKYEVIISTGVFQTPQLLMLSGIGPSDQLRKFNIPQVVNLPGVGQNLQDRSEIANGYELKKNHVTTANCTWGDDVSDPCFAAYYSTNHTNVYAQGPGIFTNFSRSNPNLDYNDMWMVWSPGFFHGYIKPGFSLEVEAGKNYWSALVLKGYTQSRGWVKLTGAHPQDLLDINKNSYNTDASKADLIALREGIRSVRRFVASQPQLQRNIVKEHWPGSSIQTDAQFDDFLRKNTWGHHACCTAKMGASNDPNAVLNNNFQVRGVGRLRVVDLSIYPNIPGLFVTVPTYMVSEKAADTVLSFAQSNSWTPTA